MSAGTTKDPDVAGSRMRRRQLLLASARCRGSVPFDLASLTKAFASRRCCLEIQPFIIVRVHARSPASPPVRALPA